MGRGIIFMKVFYIPSGVGFFHEPIDIAIIKALRQLQIDVYVYYLVKTPELNYLSILKNINPDLVLTLHGNFLRRDIMENINQTYNTAIWLVDDPYEIDNTLSYVRYFDHVFTIEKSCIPVYKNAGIKSVHWLPLASNTDRFKEIKVENKYISDICIVGTAFDKRREIIDNLADYLLSKKTIIIGRWWEKLKSL
jgi:spore maturation protein CgeB